MKPPVFNHSQYTDLEADYMILKAENEHLQAQRNGPDNTRDFVLCGTGDAKERRIMNADEIVKGLTTEILYENCPHNILHESECFTKGCYFVNAATLIESLQAQLTTTQKRLEAAEKDITALGNESCESCKLCRKCPCCKPGERGVCKGFEWRGPQDSEKGEAE